MGVTTSKASVTVDRIINAGISVMKSTVSNTSVPCTSVIDMQIEGCEDVVVEGNSFKNYATVELSSIVSSVSNTDIQQQVPLYRSHSR